MLFELLLICLGFGILARAQNNPGFISIDCGALNGHLDENLTIYYTTDVGFVESGQNMQISPKYFNQISSMQRLLNLRSFPNGTRNCYTLQPKQGKNNRYLIRASFLYGDYDNKFQGPTFDLYIDANYWVTINPSSYMYEEVIYYPSRDYIQVCLVNLGLGTPYISVLELRVLDNSTYVASGALGKWYRDNIGSPMAYRYPQDTYDRIWDGSTDDGDLLPITNTTTIDNMSSTSAYKVPVEVLMTAERTSNASYSYRYSWRTNSSNDVWYIYIHFMELQMVQQGQVRQFQVAINGKALTTVTPEYLKPVTVASLPTSGNNRMNVTITAMSQSTLPPFLNAIEVFHAIDLPNSPTHLDDVTGINSIKTIYGVAIDDWQGDPCVPVFFIWSFLNCSKDDTPRIISLNLSSSNLKGSIATSFSSLTALVSLNLSGNNLNGSIPAVLEKKMADKTLQLSLDGNPNLCRQDSNCNQDRSKKKNTVVPAVAATVGSLALVFFLICAIVVIRKRRKKIEEINTGSMEVTASKEPRSKEVSEPSTGTGFNEGRLVIGKNRPFTSAEVLSITATFRTVIGEGGFGNVFLGTLDDGWKVAVKVLSQSSKQGYKEFQAEAQLLMIVHHKNLVSLIGYCEDFDNMALIYEFMPNGNLRQHLAGNTSNVISWSQRLQIAIDAAQGLEYLHNGCRPSIIHRDLKTSNILLNENMQAKIADFGLSRVFMMEDGCQISTQPAGTPGYLDPVFNTGGNLNKKSDVYSFGIILFELITGQPAILRSPTGTIHIVKWVTPLIKGGNIQKIVDPMIHGQFNSNSIWKAIEIAMQCVQPIPVQRPDINHVLLDLKECLATQVGRGKRQGMGDHSMKSTFGMTASLEALELAPDAR
ncbi:hypothetical protein CDL15_Pgr005490 [Punica granatum]|uniref:Protein kinase domain-containing protein n=1 Tax=Punica granatum TaxID=22663 RepID=A0A218WVA4_PUNGR|nr:hypothetical protein CDL15_Pgr005490 [Punica granatum]